MDLNSILAYPSITFFLRLDDQSRRVFNTRQMTGSPTDPLAPLINKITEEPMAHWPDDFPRHRLDLDRMSGAKIRLVAQALDCNLGQGDASVSEIKERFNVFIGCQQGVIL